MDQPRRGLLKTAGAMAALLAAGVLKPMAALAANWNKEAFSAKKAEEAMSSIGAPQAQPSDAILIEAPEIAENGAVVPIQVTSKLPGTTSLAVLVEKNPYPLVAKFDFTDDALPFVRVNAKMGATSNVRVVAMAGGKHYTAVKEVKVTLGGCGG